MCRCITASAKHPAVKVIAQDAVERFGPVGTYDPATGDSVDAGAGYIARAVFWYCRYAIKRLHHQEFKSLVAAFPEKKQLLISPDALLLLEHPQGDCSAFTMAVCVLLRALGVGYELVAVAASPEDPAIYTHVYPRAILETGVRLPLDAHAGDAPGWEVPRAEVFKRQVYDADGTPVADRAQSQFKGLHEYHSWGLGDNGDTTVLSVPGQDVTTAPLTEYDSSGYQAALSQEVSDLESSLGGSSSSSSSSSSSTNALEAGILSLANTWSKIGGQVVAPTTTIVGANGQMITTPSSSLSALSSSGLLSSLSGSSSGSLLLILGLGLAAVLIFSGKK